MKIADTKLAPNCLGYFHLIVAHVRMATDEVLEHIARSRETIMLKSHQVKTEKRAGAAAVEFAVVLPLLMFMFGIGVDFARAFYAHLIITNAARNAAVYGCGDPDKAIDTARIVAEARKDTTDLGPTVGVQSGTYTDAGGTSYVWVNVTFPFETVTPFSGVVSPLIINQRAEMRIEPTLPKPSTY